jgi:hypothetical protein
MPQHENRWRRQAGDRGSAGYENYAGLGPRSYRRTDERIFEDVCERLMMHGKIDASHIQVKVEDGAVIFEGKVPDRQTKWMAEELAERVEGVSDVQNMLRVEEKQGGSQQRGQYSHGRQSRVERVGETGIYPASGPLPPGDAEVRTMGSWGEAERKVDRQKEQGGSESQIPGKQRRGSRTRR